MGKERHRNDLGARDAPEAGPSGQRRLGQRSNKCSGLLQPTPNSSIFSSGVPQRRHMTAAQSPHTSGSSTSILHNGQ